MTRERVAFLLLLFTYAALYAQEPDGAQLCDTLVSRAGRSDRNVMLNAESATVPREINIGLPESGNGAVVYVDGLKHACGLPRAQYHWSGGNAYKPVKTMSIIESLVYTGEIGIVVDSETKMGGDEFEGAFSFGTSSNGLIRFDGAAGGPLSRDRGWYWSAGAYVNFDPTSVNAPRRAFVERKQIYQLSLSKLWRSSSLSLSYRFSICNDNIDNGYGYAPFIYDGNGSVSSFNNFRIGRDCYMPGDDEVSWRDVAGGALMTSCLGRMDKRMLHDVTARFRHTTVSGWNLSASFHICRMSPCRFARISVTSITGSDNTYTLSGGSPYDGMVQNRLVTVEDMKSTDMELLFEACRNFKRHKLRTGLDFIYAIQHEAGSTFGFAHTVEANPVRLSYKGQSTWNFNTSALWLDGRRRAIALYAMDEWQPLKDLRLRTGVRLRPVINNAVCAPYNLETGVNDRSKGNFCIGDASLVDKSLKGLDYAVTEDISWHIYDRLFFNAEGFYSMTNKSTTYFKGANAPSVKPIGNAYARGGLSYDNDWMDIAALFSFITSWNNAKVMDIVDHETGETIPWTAEYGIRTLGVTIDGNLRFGGFKLHLLGTWQDPRYKNYRNEFQFSNGNKVIDYTGKYVTGISRFMVEFDPSYSWSRHRVWTSLRYYSRQYASRNNLAWFNGHVETFAGFDTGFGKYSELSLNFVNVLWQNGAKGSVDFIDTVEDQSLLNNRLISGTFIRPFTVELKYTFSF